MLPDFEYTYDTYKWTHIFLHIQLGVEWLAAWKPGSKACFPRQK